MITFIIDETIPCLKDVETGEIYETEVVRLRRKSFLSKFNKRTGWYINWGNFDDTTEIYALVLKGTVDIQGLIAIRFDDENKAVNIVWACTAPQNNVWKYKKQKFSGVGGHLFAIASELSVKKSYDGFIYGEAIDEALYHYYLEHFGAYPLPAINNNPFRFMLSDEVTSKLREVYNYEWSNEEL